MNKESICRNCFHSYVCEQFNENKDDNNTKCHFANDHYIPTADVVPRAMIEEIFEEIEKIRAKEIHKCETLREKESDPSERKYWEGGYNSLRQLSYWIAELTKKYTEGE